MKTLLVSDELYEKLTKCSKSFKTIGQIVNHNAIDEFLQNFKLADSPCLDCPKKEYRETINNRR
jgi:hypothetical protein